MTRNSHEMDCVFKLLYNPYQEKLLVKNKNDMNTLIYNYLHESTDVTKLFFVLLVLKFTIKVRACPRAY